MFGSNVPYPTLLNPELADLKAYIPDLGDYAIRLDANEAPAFEDPTLRHHFSEITAKINWTRYPDPTAAELRQALARRCGAFEDEVLVGAGSDELITLLMTGLTRSALAHNPPTVLTVSPTFVMYKMSARVRGFRVVEVPLDENWDLAEKSILLALEAAPPNILFIASPNNPTGNLASRDRLERVLDAASNTVCVIDEAYIDYAHVTQMDLRKRFPNLIVLRTLSKIGFAALRVGWMVGPRALIQELNKARLPYNLSTVSQALATAIVTHLNAHISELVDGVISERERLARELGKLEGYAVTPSEANFLWIKTTKPAQNIDEFLRSRGILVRSFHERGGRLAHQLRITVGSAPQNDRLLEALALA